MTVAPKIDVRDLRSIRRATEGTGTDHVLATTGSRPRPRPTSEMRDSRRRRRWIHAQPLAAGAQIITFNLVALFFLVAGLMYLSPTRDNLALQRAISLANEAALIANVFEVQLPVGGPVSLIGGDGIDVPSTLAALDLRTGVRVEVFDPTGVLLGSALGLAESREVIGLEAEQRGTWLADLVGSTWAGLVDWLAPETAAPAPTVAPEGAPSVPEAMAGQSVMTTTRTSDGRQIITATVPILRGGEPVGVVALTSESEDLEALIQSEREQLLPMFVMGGIPVDRPEPGARLDHRQPAVGPGRRRRTWPRPQRPQDVAGAHPHTRPDRPPGRDRAAVGGAARHGLGAL